MVSAVTLWRGLRDRSYWHHFGERFGFGARLEGSGIWVHAVSVGEVQASAALVSTLRERYPEVPVIVTAFTPTGVQRARSLFKNLADVRYIPYDLPGSVRRFLDRVHPRLAVIFETELWPNLYRECGRRRVPLVLASARLSPRSVERYRRLGALFRETLARAVIVAAQGAGDADRFRSLGADPDSTHVTGNLKFDFAVPPDIAERGRRLRELYGSGRPVWVAGSTHSGGEEEAVLEAHRRVRGVFPGALLVMAPRRPNRFDEVAERFMVGTDTFVPERWRLAGVRFVRRSQEFSRVAIDQAEALLLDSLGELLEFYASADVAFVGGSLVPIGGHNLLEPAALGVPILTGPHNFNSQDIARLLIARGAAEVVHGWQELADRVTALLADPDARARIGEQGRASVDGNRGALVKLLWLIEPLLAERA